MICTSTIFREFLSSNLFLIIEKKKKTGDNYLYIHCKISKCKHVTLLLDDFNPAMLSGWHVC
jgi:hypothetical protein